MKLFIDPKDLVEFSLFVGMNAKTNAIDVADNLETLKKVEGMENSETTELKFAFRKPTYKDTVSILRGNLTSDGSTLEFDPSRLRYERMVSLISTWNLTDEKGNLVPANRESIDKLNPSLAAAIVNRFESALQL